MQMLPSRLRVALMALFLVSCALKPRAPSLVISLQPGWSDHRSEYVYRDEIGFGKGLSVFLLNDLYRDRPYREGVFTITEGIRKSFSEWVPRNDPGVVLVGRGDLSGKLTLSFPREVYAEVRDKGESAILELRGNGEVYFCGHLLSDGGRIKK